MKKKVKDPEKDKLTKRIQVRLSKEQYEHIANLTKATNYNFSTMFRMLSLNSKLVLHSVADKETITALSKIGVNLNQTVRKINKLNLENEMAEQLIEINSVILEIRKTIQNLES
jgi:hypothetical protein